MRVVLNRDGGTAPDSGAEASSRGASERQVARLRNLIELATTLAAEHNTRNILNLMLRHAIDLVDEITSGIVYRLEESTGELRPEAAVGFGPTVYNLRLRSGEGIAGLCALRRATVVLESPEVITQVLSKIRQENERAFVEASLTAGPMEWAAAVPLISRGAVLGVIVLQSRRPGTRADEESIDVLETYAALAAVALESAALHSSEQKARIRLEALHQEVTLQRDGLARQARALDDLLRCASGEANLDRVCTSLARTVGLHVAFYDTTGRLRATDQAPQAGHSPASEPVVDQQALEPFPEQLPTSSVHQRYRSEIVTEAVVVLPIQLASRERVATLVSRRPSGRHDDIDRSVLQSAALITQGLLSHERQMLEREMRRSADLIRMLLDGTYLDTLVERPVRWPVRLICIELQSPRPDDSVPFDLLYEVREVLLQRLSPLTRGVARECAVVHGRLVALLGPCPEEGGLRQVLSSELARLERDVADRLGGRTLRAVVSAGIPKPDEVPAHYHEARFVLATAKYQGGPLLLDDFRLGPLRLLAASSRLPEIVAQARATLEPILGDEARGQHLLETLDAFLRVGPSKKDVARTLNVHVNTVYYRLRQIEDACSFNLNDPEDRLAVELAMRILPIVEPEVLGRTGMKPAAP